MKNITIIKIRESTQPGIRKCQTSHLKAPHEYSSGKYFVINMMFKFSKQVYM